MPVATLSASLEDYLEAIFHIVREKRAARPKDISERLKVGASSVTNALKALADRNMVNYAPYDIVTLTPSGEVAAADVVRRHEALRDFFVKVLAADPTLAEKAACQMEHAVPPDLVDRFVRFVEFVEMCPRGGPGLLDGFRVHLERGCRPKCFDECRVETPVPNANGKQTQTEATTLADLEPGRTGTVTRIQGDGTLRRRLMDLGIMSGTRVTMERSAPLGDPLEVLVKGTHLSLRSQEASVVQVALDD